MKKLLDEKLSSVVLGFGYREEKDEIYCDFASKTTPNKQILEELEKEYQKLLGNIDKISIKEDIGDYISKIPEELRPESEHFKDYVLLSGQINGEPIEVPIAKELLDKVKKDQVIYFVRTSSSHIGNKVYLRVYFKLFDSEEELQKYIEYEKELQKSDHRYIGEKLDLFSFNEDLIGSGLPLFHPKGTILRNKIIDLIRVLNDYLGFQEVTTPHLYKIDIMKVSGHYDKYREDMFVFEANGQEYAIKPMNCPAHICIVKSRPRTYKEYPIKFSEFATVYRKEKSGELKGLLRVIFITQDDHHIFAREQDLKPEIQKVISGILSLYEVLGFKEFNVCLSTKPEKYIGSDEIWDLAESRLKEILEDLGIDYEIKEGEGAFYGPKIDFDVRDAQGRWWQLGTIQLDFFMPMRFDIRYKDQDEQEKRPIMIHIACVGSIERFMGVFLEHTRGNLPFYFAPVQIAIIPVSEKFLDHAKELYKKLKKNGFRTVLMSEERSVAYRIRRAEDEKIPVMIVIGQREAESKVYPIRLKGRGQKELPEDQLINFLKGLNEEIKNNLLSKLRERIGEEQEL